MAEEKDPKLEAPLAPAAEAGEKVRLPVVVPTAQLTKRPTGNVLGQAWLVLVLATVFGAGLAGVEYALGPIIAQNRLNETLAQVPSLVPGATQGTADDAVIEGRRVFRALDADGKLVGWVVPGKGQGFADKIELVVGLDAKAETITGLFVLDQKETPALGDNITRADFRGQFVGFGTGVPLDAKRAPRDPGTGTIQALTGATISSDAVCTIVNQTVAAVKAPLAAAASPVAVN
ncbi:MAG: FMN-binding protein [Polyangiaceae bacterium]|nr:FMN-binding protein [Polyangiaceae bacterium]